MRTTTIINDTVNWVRVSGSIIADSACNYVALGNFFDDAHTDTLTSICGNCVNLYSYYLIDDVCISTDSSTCFADSSNPVVPIQNSGCNMETFNVNVITPNGDGINDYLDFSIYNLKKLSFIVINRWGNIVFTSIGTKLKWTNQRWRKT